MRANVTARIRVVAIAFGLATAMLLLFALGSGPSKAAAQVDSTATISTSGKLVEVGDVVQVELLVEPGNVAVGAVGIELSYDPLVVQPVLNADGEPDCVFDAAVVGFCGPTPPVNLLSVGAFNSGAGWNEDLVVAVAPFLVVGQPGDESPLEISVTRLVDTDSLPLPQVVRNGSIAVGLRGDLDCDNAVTINDARYAEQAATLLRSPADACPLAVAASYFAPLGDVDGDDDVTINDARMLTLCAIGLVSCEF